MRLTFHATSPMAFESLFAILVLQLALHAQAPPPTTTFLSFREVSPILTAMKDALPPSLATPSADSWMHWAKAHDAEIRARLVRGDEDSLVNLLAMGTSFTKQPRLAGNSRNVPSFTVIAACRSMPRCHRISQLKNHCRR